MAAVDDETAQRLLKAYMPIAGAFAGLYPNADRDELLAAGQIAIIEAYVKYRPDRGTKESTWVRRMLWWRIEEAAARQPWERGAESLDVDPQVVNGANPEQQFWKATAVRAVARLSPRHQMIVDGRMKGETYEEIGVQLGLSLQRVEQEAKKAFGLLRSMLEGK